ncbi:hypothetical protein LUZ28_26765 [Streptomyces albireticuli]|nr:hypothetical protein [Streptomyces albireticuli]MCD9165741.1 hypothetical protein [Streptomyces albireticuli]
MSILILFVCVEMTVVALWRLPATRYGDPLRRALWGCSAGWAVALWARFPPVKNAIDGLGVNDLSALVKDFACMAASLALLNYAVTSYGVSQDAPPRRFALLRGTARFARWATVGVIPVMLVMFFVVVDRSRPSRDFAADHAGQWGVVVFSTLFYLYLGLSCTTCGYQWGHVGRRAESPALRIGMVLGSVGLWLLAAYSVVRVSFVWGTIFVPASPDVSHTVGSLSSLLNVLAAALFASGASLPTTEVVVQRWSSHRMLWRLHPLRRDLARQFPDLSFQPLAPRLREALRFTPALDVRLDRAVQEVGDAVEQLRHYVVPELWAVIEDVTAEHPDQEAMAEAYWIAAALRSARQGRRFEVPAPALPSKPFADSVSEGRWLVRVQDSYARITPAAVDKILDRADRRFTTEHV